MKRHILIITTWYPTGTGDPSGIFIRDQALALAARGNRVGVLFANIRSVRALRPWMIGKGFFHDEVLRDHGVAVYRLDGWNVPPRTRAVFSLWYRKIFPLFGRYCEREGKPDIIHAHGVLGSGVFAQRLAGYAGIPYVVTEHSSFYAEGLVGTRFYPLVRDILAGAAARIVVSPDLGRILSEFSRADLPFETIPNSIDTDFFTPGPPSPEYSFSPEDTTFLSIASHTRVKRIDLLLRAFASRFKNGGASLILIGGGPLRNKHERLAQRLGIRERVHFLGVLPRTKVRDAIRSSDCVVLASLYETFGVALCEAMSCGKPVITTDSGGPASYVDETNGMLVKNADEETLGDCLAVMSQRHARYDSVAIRSRCVDRFGKDTVCVRLENLYKGSIE